MQIHKYKTNYIVKLYYNNPLTAYSSCQITSTSFNYIKIYNKTNKVRY